MPRPFTIGGLRAWEWPGDPPGALLMHGIGNYARYWDFFADAIAGRLRLVAYDARGHGESPKPAQGYAPSDFVADAVAIMDGAALTGPIVVGHSMGGYHAAALALVHAHRVRALVLVDVGPRVEQAGASRARRLSLGRPDHFPDEAAALAYLKETSPGYSDAVYDNRLEFAFRRFAGGGLEWRSSKDALKKILDATEARPATWDRLHEIACPVLIVRGTRSPSFASETAHAMLTTVRDARLVELDAGHNVALDRPHELADAVLSFVRGLS